MLKYNSVYLCIAMENVDMLPVKPRNVWTHSTLKPVDYGGLPSTDDAFSSLKKSFSRLQIMNEMLETNANNKATAKTTTDVLVKNLSMDVTFTGKNPRGNGLYTNFQRVCRLQIDGTVTKKPDGNTCVEIKCVVLTDNPVELNLPADFNDEHYRTEYDQNKHNENPALYAEYTFNESNVYRGSSSKRVFNSLEDARFFMRNSPRLCPLLFGDRRWLVEHLFGDTDYPEWIKEKHLSGYVRDIMGSECFWTETYAPSKFVTN